MTKSKELHSPTLASILMVEAAICKYQSLGKYQLWCKLPRKIMYQTFLVILKYLEQSGKINILGKKVILTRSEQKICEQIGCPSYIG